MEMDCLIVRKSGTQLGLGWFHGVCCHEKHIFDPNMHPTIKIAQQNCGHHT